MIDLRKRTIQNNPKKMKNMTQIMNSGKINRSKKSKKNEKHGLDDEFENNQGIKNEKHCLDDDLRKLTIKLKMKNIIVNIEFKINTITYCYLARFFI